MPIHSFIRGWVSCRTTALRVLTFLRAVGAVVVRCFGVPVVGAPGGSCVPRARAVRMLPSFLAPQRVPDPGRVSRTPPGVHHFPGSPGSSSGKFMLASGHPAPRAGRAAGIPRRHRHEVRLRRPLRPVYRLFLSQKPALVLHSTGRVCWVPDKPNTVSELLASSVVENTFPEESGAGASSLPPASQGAGGTRGSKATGSVPFLPRLLQFPASFRTPAGALPAAALHWGSHTAPLVLRIYFWRNFF